VPQTAPSPSEIGLRPFLPADLPFLQALYDSTRVREMALIPWPERQKQAFLRQQLSARETHYAAAHPQGAHDVVVVEGCDAGRLLVDSTPVEVLVVDIALLPQHRGRGVGTRLLHQVLVQAGDRPVRLHVDPENVARRLYVRLGFTSVRVEGFHELMERLP
jgi:ribosomal protein S18 acetylase RimI-like enzyme